MISVGFNRPKMRSCLVTYGALLVAEVAVAVIACCLSMSHSAFPQWAQWLMLPLMFLMLVPIFEYTQWVGDLWRGLKRKNPAFIINQTGIVDNASNFCLGQLTWDEIQKMYPWDWNSRLILNWWTKMPITIKQRGVVILLKDGVDFQHRVRRNPWIVRLLMKGWCMKERKRWLFIPEMLLDVTAEEFMQGINSFYISQVRNAA